MTGAIDWSELDSLVDPETESGTPGAQSAAVPAVLTHAPLADEMHAPAEPDARPSAHLVALAREAAAGLVGLATESLRRKELDADDVPRMLPPIFRIVEHAEKLEAQKKDGAGLAVMHVTFDFSAADGPATSQRALTPNVINRGEVIDAAPMQVTPDGGFVISVDLGDAGQISGGVHG